MQNERIDRLVCFACGCMIDGEAVEQIKPGENALHYSCAGVTPLMKGWPVNFRGEAYFPTSGNLKP